MTLAPLVLAVYDKDFAAQDWVAAPVSVEVVVADRAPGWATVVVNADDDAIPALSATGARMVIDYRYDPLAPTTTKRLLSGRVVERTGDPDVVGLRTFDVVDDWSILQDVAGWPNPTGTIDQQGDDEAYYTLTGPAETVVKTLVQVNAVNRLGLPVTIAPDLARGDSIDVSVRMHPLADRLWPAVDLAGLVVTVDQSGPGLALDVHEPDVLPNTLTQASGIVLGGKWSLTAPTATRAIVLGQGVGTARTMRMVVDTALEAEWNTVIEVVIDARDTDDPAVLDKRGLQALADGAPRTGVVAELAETDEFRYGVTYDVGDVVSLQLEGSPVLTDRVRQVRVQWSAQDGLLLTPRVGDVVDDPDAVLWQAVTSIARTQRDQGAT